MRSVWGLDKGLGGAGVQGRATLLVNAVEIPINMKRS